MILLWNYKKNWIRIWFDFWMFFWPLKCWVNVLSAKLRKSITLSKAVQCLSYRFRLKNIIVEPWFWLDYAAQSIFYCQRLNNPKKATSAQSASHYYLVRGISCGVLLLNIESEETFADSLKMTFTSAEESMTMTISDSVPQATLSDRSEFIPYLLWIELD